MTSNNLPESQDSAENQNSGARASTIGALPDSVGGFLLATIIIGIVLMGTALGFSPAILMVIITSGLLSAAGIRGAVTTHLLTTVGGIASLWIGAILFTLGTAALVIDTQAVTIPVIVAAVTALAPFGILGNTIQSYGHGTGRRLLAQFTAGNILLAVIVLLISLGTAYYGITISTLSTTFDTAVGGVGDTGPWVRIGTAILLYTTFLYTVWKTAHNFPFEALSTPSDIDRLRKARDSIDRIHFYTRFLILAYAITGLVVFEQLAGNNSVRGAETTLTVLDILAHPNLLLIIAVVTGSLLIVLVIVTTTRKLSVITGLDIVKISVPPLVLLTLGVAATTIFANEITDAFLTYFSSEMTESGTIFYSLLTATPPLIILVLLPVALVCTAIVFSIPSVIATMAFGDASFAGITAATLSLTVFVTVAALTNASFILVVIGVGLAAVVWEIGEYSTVAMGEIKSPATTAAVPEDFTSIVVLHTAITAVVAFIGVILASVTVIAFSGITVTEPVATFALVLCSIALGTILLVLSG